MKDKFKPEDDPAFEVGQYNLNEAPYDLDCTTHAVLFGWSQKEQEERGDGNPYRVYFKVVTVVSMDEKENLLFKYFGEEGYYDPTPDIFKADYFIQGYVNWDGCANLEFDDIHTCERFHMTRIGAILGEIYDYADKKMRIESFFEKDGGIAGAMKDN